MQFAKLEAQEPASRNIICRGRIAPPLRTNRENANLSALEFHFVEDASGLIYLRT